MPSGIRWFPVVVLIASVGACSRPNPGFNQGGSTTGGAGSSGETSGGLEAGSVPDEGAGQGSVEEAGESSGEGSGDSDSESGLCGNGVPDPGEDCDDGNEDNDDGCLFNCVIPETCAEILEMVPEAPSGDYEIDPLGTGDPWLVACDMELDDGGWTGFEVQDTCNGNLDSSVTALAMANSSGVDKECRPFAASSEGGGNYNYAFDIEFPPGFDAFFLRDFESRAIGTPELNYDVMSWTDSFGFPRGSLSLGDADQDAPATVWIHEGGTDQSWLDEEIKPYPVLELPFELDRRAQTLRINWAEAGIELEGLYPWWSGRVFVR